MTTELNNRPLSNEDLAHLRGLICFAISNIARYVNKENAI